jgi:ribosomal protein S18 acetylase RimI-like enzyme
MRVATYQRVGCPLSETAWSVYQAAFDHLRTRAAQRHLMLPREFDAVMADERVTKLLVFHESGDHVPGLERLVAMSTLTNELDAMPLISPEYYAHRWPVEYAEGRIWYVGFLAVDSDYQGTGAAVLLVGEVTRHLTETGGVIAADFCTHNENKMKLPTLFLRMARTYASGGSLVRLDAQTYWACEFPGATSRARAQGREAALPELSGAVDDVA